MNTTCKKFGNFLKCIVSLGHVGFALVLLIPETEKFSSYYVVSSVFCKKMSRKMVSK